ncbi:hypothetical protein [Flavobacterium sp. GT3R68]|uniref:hypothetical protein n=1 Tax=Flavobacterium sp. GT3R68 TaxID=2594437 RepID=UPI000F86F5A7|nr:hypothetical protein [Flavobacterium sp. GT3R68]RTY89137.1 hypothetical protein EKL32_24250 [Flavobacterium sp. GSN2]TRW90065.1 hypothetical protein FNW07_11440 [Flavobacterium sp. GT3R68]
MDFCKKQYLLIIFLALLLLGCSNDDGSNALEIKVTNFQASYNQVKFNWELTRPNGIIIEDLLVYRISKNSDTDYPVEQLVTNLPSNATEFIDNNIPYKIDVSYKIRINYTDQRILPIVNGSLESEPQKFIRDIVMFDMVPFQVQKDPFEDNVFHIMDRSGNGALKRYNSTQQQITNTRGFTNSFALNNRFHIVNGTDIYVADTQGKISKITTANYQSTATYFTAISNRLNAFAVDGDRIYYQDYDILKFYTMSNGMSASTGIGSSANYMEPLGEHNILSCYGSAAGIRYYTPTNCNTNDCNPVYGINNYGQISAQNVMEPNLFSWNPTKSKFISSIDGRVYNISTLQQEIKLNNITGKKYFQFAFDADNNIYATVQGEKKIHKFNSSYELIETIDTKLYPLFPMVTSTGISVIGSYEPVSYWGSSTGENFYFNVKCAVETF